MYEEAGAVRDRLAELVDRLDPDLFPGSAARDLWRVLDSAERLRAAGKTLLARRIATTHKAANGARSAAEELARSSGSSTGQAKDSVETSQRLPEQPAVEAALRRGELSAQQAAAISAAAEADPAQADRLVESADRLSLPELREECARVRAAADPDPEATNRRLHQKRCLRRYTDAEGFWNLHAKGTPQAGAAINAVVDTLTDYLFQQARREGRREPYEAYAFDALLTMADHAATNTSSGGTRPASGPEGSRSSAVASPRSEANGDPSTSSGLRTSEPGTLWEPESDDVSSEQPTPAATAPDDGRAERMPDQDALSGVDPIGRRGIPARYLALLRVDVEALRRGQLAGDELCEIRGVGPIPVPVAEGVLGQAILKLVITRGVDVLNVTHLGRGPTIAQKIALAWQTPTCTVQGCWRARIEHDHREPWAKTRHTRLDELDPLCEFHHDLKTRHHWALVPGLGKRPLVPPDDPRHPQTAAGCEEARAP